LTHGFPRNNSGAWLEEQQQQQKPDAGGCAAR
jgi:hypothetical protein